MSGFGFFKVSSFLPDQVESVAAFPTDPMAQCEALDRFAQECTAIPSITISTKNGDDRRVCLHHYRRIKSNTVGRVFF